jgi:hypothetical protein
VQSAGTGYPLFEDRREKLPSLLCALTAANQNTSPEPIDAHSESAQLIDVARFSMVLVVAGNDLASRHTSRCVPQD